MTEQLSEIVIVRWHDAGSGADCEEASNHFRCSVGYRVKTVRPPEKKAGIYIAMESDCLSNVHYIPWAMVVSITPIKAIDE